MAVLLGFVLFPLAEIAAFILVAQWISIWPAFLTLVLGSVLGAYILKKQGLVKGATKELRGVLNPVSLVAHKALITLAGLLLFIPGFISGFFGLLLLIPWVRIGVIAWVAARLVAKRREKADAEPVIDGDFVVVEPARLPDKPND